MSEEMNKEAEVQEEAVEIPVTDGSEEAAADTAQTKEASKEETSTETAEEKEPADDKTEEADSRKEPETKSKTSFFGKKKKEKDKFEQQIEELTDRLKRSMAEFDNYRKRT